jgi:hypothetical protein
VRAAACEHQRRAADLPKIIRDEIHRLIVVSRYNRGRPTGSTYTQLRQKPA